MRLLLISEIQAFVVVVVAVGVDNVAAASHRPGGSNPVGRDPACWNRSNLLLPDDIDDVTFSADSRPRN